MHSDEMEVRRKLDKLAVYVPSCGWCIPIPIQDIPSAHAGDICALFGIECSSGDTFVTEGAAKYTMVSPSR